MSSGGKGGRSSKGSRQATDRNSGGGTTHSHQPKSDHNHNEKDKDSIHHKIAPTAEQLRIAQMIDNTHSEPEKVLQEKINQVMQVTGVSQDDAIVALHDCDNDVTAAIDALLEGEDNGEWRESTKKKKKAPASKTKEEVESNKENRGVETRERSSSKPRGGSGAPPRFRGRGGGRGGREDNGDGYSRGAGSRRGKMTNGTVPASRGRGTRGRGSSSLTSRTFQKRQPPSFTETIDTWGAAPTEKIKNSANDLQIDNWDEETSGTTEDWDGEWTGSLDTTTVFKPSGGAGVNVPVNDVQDTSPNISNTGPIHSSNLGSVGSVIGSSGNTDASSHNRGINSLELQQNFSESVNVLSMGQSQLSASPMNVSSSFSSVVPSSGSMTITQSQAIDLAALLQKAAPHSTVGRLPPQMVDTSAMCSASLVGDTKQSILSGITSSVGDSLKTSVQINNRVSAVSSPGSQSYSPSSSISNSMFSSSVSSLGNSLTSGSGVSKVLGLSTQNSSLASRTKPSSRRLPQSSSKIPSSAVEMPEVAMAALDMQFTGLEFGTESFDFTSDVKPIIGSNLVSGSMGSSRDPSGVVAASVAKDLNSLNSSLSQQQQALGPQPIPYPIQANERKPPSASLLSNTQRSSGPGPTSVTTSQSLADLTKKDSSPGGGHLGNLVESSSSGHSAYQPSSGAIYGSKSSSNFPSPPTAHYAQTSSQNYSSSSQSGVGNNSYGGSSVSSSGGSNNSCNSNQSTGGGYGSGYAVQSSIPGGQYQNNYVNVSSHSLASISVPKTQTLTGLKDPSQNYNDSSASSLSSSLSTNVSVGGSNSGTGGLSSSMNSVTSSSIQPTKNSVPGKIVNSMGGTVPPNVQQHSVTQSQQQQLHVTQQQLNQHHQTHHHLQQQQVAQQAQQTQMLAGPGPSQYVSTQTAALQGSLPPTFYNVQQPAMYSFEDLQMFQRVPHMPQAPTTLAGGRDGTITSPGSYSVADVAKFRTDQNSSPVPSTINQQGAAAAGTYIQATQNAALPPFYMYQPMPAVPSSFTQYGTPAIILPPSTHTGSNTTQFPGPPKLPYGQGTSTYYDTMSQTQDYKAGYGTGTQTQNKTGPNPSGSSSNSATDLTGYKNHLGKYDKQGFHSANPQTFNMAGSGTNPMTANYTQMFIPTMPAAAQHHSTMMHHQLHQVRSNQMDGGSSAAQRTGSSGGQSKGGSKGGYSGSYWGTN